uniref:Peptidyl-prolyl cis-trans isomerase n=1 Tax=Ananas comosus var. bracteatus TaxID=296719 RepID=A0A6V7QL00_ANACO|nr:unnamed protein product [Ananas comosus var. bracteatus]
MASSGARRGGEEEVRASHILIKHEGSRRRASWRDPEGRVIAPPRATPPPRASEPCAPTSSKAAPASPTSPPPTPTAPPPSVAATSADSGGDRCRSPSKKLLLPSRWVRSAILSTPTVGSTSSCEPVDLFLPRAPQ